MAKFKHGDIVGYMHKNTPSVSGPHTYDHTDADGRAWFATGAWMPESRLFAWPSKEDSKCAGPTGSWDYAEARRLKDAAKAAVEAYNAYVAQKPTDVFIQVMQPFQ